MEYFAWYIVGGFIAIRLILKMVEMNSEGEVDAVFQKATENYTHKHYHNRSGIGIDSASRKIHLFSEKTDKIYDFSDIREWTTKYVTGGEEKNNKNKTGLFIHVRDIDNPLWQINFLYGSHTDKELAKWMEILTADSNLKCNTHWVNG